MKSALSLLLLFVIFLAVHIKWTEATHGHGHGHGHYAKGTACIVKGSYCNCHYCKCEKGHVHCGGYGKGGYGKYFIKTFEKSILIFIKKEQPLFSYSYKHYVLILMEIEYHATLEKNRQILLYFFFHEIF